MLPYRQPLMHQNSQFHKECDFARQDYLEPTRQPSSHRQTTQKYINQWKTDLGLQEKNVVEKAQK